MAVGGGPMVVAAEIAPATDNTVPEKIDALFAQYDTNGDGVISEEELASSLEKAFPDMKQWARDHIPVQFAKYASGEPKGLDKPCFTKLYAAFLFRYFDESGDGELQVSECEQALKFLAGKDTAVACPPGDSAGVVSKLDFWLSTRGITDRT